MLYPADCVSLYISIIYKVFLTHQTQTEPLVGGTLSYKQKNTQSLWLFGKLFLYLQPHFWGLNINNRFIIIYAYNSTVSSQRARGYRREEQIPRT